MWILLGRLYHSRSVDAGLLVECKIAALGRLGGTVVAVDSPRATRLCAGHAPTNGPDVGHVALGFDERVPEHFEQHIRNSNGLSRWTCIVTTAARSGQLGFSCDEVETSTNSISPIICPAVRAGHGLSPESERQRDPSR